ncbi:MAG: hypothetical protein GXY39_11605 [Actinomycetales bacterium]|nr:hypothetical protein [Tetrasphaera sp.]NLX00333.1 hypothetical protein [Actinomycetales bacterium]
MNTYSSTTARVLQKFSRVLKSQAHSLDKVDAVRTKRSHAEHVPFHRSMTM